MNEIHLEPSMRSDERFTYLAKVVGEVGLLERISFFKGAWQADISVSERLHKRLR